MRLHETFILVPTLQRGNSYCVAPAVCIAGATLHASYLVGRESLPDKATQPLKVGKGLPTYRAFDFNQENPLIK
jgi:hypothetical protein